MPETKGGVHRIPVAECEITATIDLSKEKRIQALYCGKEKKIHTYLFDADRWSMSDAQAWVEEHKGKQSEAETLGRKGGPEAAGPDGMCKCPGCGYEVEHETAKPCSEVKCPECGAMMERVPEGEKGEETAGEQESAPFLALSLPAAERLARGDLDHIVHMGDLDVITLAPILITHEGYAYAKVVLSRPVSIGADIYSYDVKVLEVYDPPTEAETRGEIVAESMRQAFGSPGGKHLLAGTIMGLMPKHKTFVEAFTGGGAVFFKKEKGASQTEVLNDIYADLMSTYKFIRDASADEVKKFKSLDWVLQKPLWEKLKAMKPSTPLQRAYRFIYVRLGSFAHGEDTFSPSQQDSGRKVGMPDRFEALQERLEGVKLHNEDWLSVARKYDAKDTWVFCTPPGTLVRMSDGTLKPIEDVEIGDYVVGGKVKKCFERFYSGDLVGVRAMGFADPLWVTPEHPIFIRETRRKIRSNNMIVDRSKPLFIPAGQVHVDDLVAVPLGEISESIPEVLSLPHCTHGRGRTVIPKPVLDGDFLWLIGVFLAEGSAGKRHSQLSFGDTGRDSKLIHRTKEVLKKSMGIVPGEHKTSPGAMQLLIGNTIFSTWFADLCGRGAHNKRLRPDLLSLPSVLLLEVVKGWMEGDGGHARSGRNRAKITGTSVSKELALQMFSILLRCGFKPAMKQRVDNWDVYLSSSADIARFLEKRPYCRDRSKRKIEDGIIWSPVTRVETQKYEGFVYNLEVSGTNTYIADFILAHNCDPPYPGDKPGWDKTPDGPTVEELAKGLKSLSSMWLLTINDTKEVISAFKGANIKRVKISARAGRGGDMTSKADTELMIANYPLKGTQKESEEVIIDDDGQEYLIEVEDVQLSDEEDAVEITLLDERVSWRLPPFSNEGGSYFLAPTVRDLFPPHDTFVETHAGAGSVLFSTYPVATEVLNDMDTELIHAYEDIQALTLEQLIELKNKNWHPWKRKFDDLKESESRDEVDRLYRFLYLSWYSFNENRKDYRGRPKNWNLEARLGRVENARVRLREVHLTTEDGIACIERWDSPTTAFFLDPPFPQSEGDSALASALKEVLGRVKGKFVLRISDTPEHRDLLSEYNVMSTTAVRRASQVSAWEDGEIVSARSELLVTNCVVPEGIEQPAVAGDGEEVNVST